MRIRLPSVIGKQIAKEYFGCSETEGNYVYGEAYLEITKDDMFVDLYYRSTKAIDYIVLNFKSIETGVKFEEVCKDI